MAALDLEVVTYEAATFLQALSRALPLVQM
jgi:hypothetical protein